jgi:hypothetical protein
VISEFSQLLDDWYANPGSCNVDADCKLVTPTLRCADGSLHIEECALPTTAARAAEIATRVDALLVKGCPLNCGYGSTPDCAVVAARCVSGACRGEHDGG